VGQPDTVIGPGLVWRGAGGYVIVPSPGLLAPVDGRFSQGFDTPDLKEAEALLDGAYHLQKFRAKVFFWSPRPSASVVMKVALGSS
jgi:hypothetical protein